MNPKKIVLAVAATSVLVAAPALPAAAKQGQGKQGQQKAAKKLAAKAKKCSKLTKVGFVAQGSLGSFDETSVTLTVTKQNKHARTWLTGNDPSFSLAGAKLAFEGIADANGNGVGLDDVVASDRVRVIGKLAQPKRGCEGASALTVKKIQAVREVAEEDESEVPAQS